MTVLWWIISGTIAAWFLLNGAVALILAARGLLRLWFVLLLLCWVATPAFAETPALVMGVGITTCAQFALDFQSNPGLLEDRYFDWAQGYMSVLNLVRQNPKNLRALPIETQKASVRRYCSDHPLADYSDAIHLLLDQMPEMSAPQNLNQSTIVKDFRVRR